jgi:sigma-B regulation protein RsbU (phosphoserine phosphatase)
MRYLWLFCLSASLGGQTLTLPHFQDGSASVAGRWRFHPGDDPRWADPNFDDSGWAWVQVPRNLGAQGYPHFSGYGWYRRELRLGATLAAQDLQLLIGPGTPGFWAYEVYANGHQVGHFGSLPPQERLYPSRLMSFALPKLPRSGQTQLLLAIRFWVSAPSARDNLGGLGSGPLEIGTAPMIQNRFAVEQHRQWRSRVPDGIVHGTMLLLAAILLALYSLDRRPEYLWLGLAFAARAFQVAVPWLLFDTFLWTMWQGIFVLAILGWLNAFCGVYGLWALLEVPVERWVKTVLFAWVPFGWLMAWTFERGDVLAQMLDSIWAAIGLGLCLVIVGFTLWRSRNVAAQTRWLAVSFVPEYLLKALWSTGHVAPALQRLVDPDLFQGLIPNVSVVVTAVAFGYLLLRRFGTARAEQERLHTELKTARQVQRLMLPAQSVTIPHLRVDTVYLPAQEVGGDFFQIAQTREGSLLLVIGDVSGKGLQAALTVSFLVGLWQDVIDGSEQSPRSVLSWLNEQLLRRVPEGFVTCLCVRLSANGSLTVANAGHLAPYVNGRELVTANGLPLGISAEVEYSETQHVLAPEDTLTLISDGVVEARDKARRLFGFERLQQALSERLEADAIARSAQQFGQEDDITVISISRQAVGIKPLPQAQTASIAV